MLKISIDLFQLESFFFQEQLIQLKFKMKNEHKISSLHFILSIPKMVNRSSQLECRVGLFIY